MVEGSNLETANDNTGMLGVAIPLADRALLVSHARLDVREAAAQPATYTRVVLAGGAGLQTLLMNGGRYRLESGAEKLGHGLGSGKSHAQQTGIAGGWLVGRGRIPGGACEAGGKRFVHEAVGGKSTT